jgi:tetratricopeptide (TPR) repeat protein
VLLLREVPRLAEMRLQAVELALDAGLRLNPPAVAIGELQRLVAEHPLRERLHALLMLTLYCDSRQGEALAAYQDARRVLMEELGAEPGPGLQELHRQILVGDPVLNEAPARPAGPAGTTAATRTLPRDIASFTGRRAELSRLTVAAAGGDGIVGIQAIGGMAGVGKTTFAVHAAHRLSPRFPDGQFFVALHGHTPGYRPAHPAEVLAGLLATVGFAAGRIPPLLAERAGLWRDHLAGKRVLLVLDDAVSSDQVTPLLPGTRGSMVLVTSRRHLTALADAQVISLDVLAPAEATALLVRLAARAGLMPDDPAVAELCALCGHLPLGIAMLARRLHYHPAWTPAGLATELAAARDRLELMAAENVSVSAAFDLSYADLTLDQRRLFRRLGLHPGSDIDAYAAAALDGCQLLTARHKLQVLYEHCLLTEPAAGRYRLHDLLREHAHARAVSDDTAGDRDQALRRLLEYYTHTAGLAETHLARQRRPGQPSVSAAPAATVPELSDSTAALAWIRAERTNLLACLDQATSAGDNARVVALTASVASLLWVDGPWPDAAARHTTAAQAARQSGDRLGQANALCNLGNVRRLMVDFPRTAQAFADALAIYRELGDRCGQAAALCGLGFAHRLAGDYPAAAQTSADALRLSRDLGDQLGQASALGELGIAHRGAGDYSGAIQRLAPALRLHRDLDCRLGQVNVLIELGVVRRLTGDYPAAARDSAEALRLSRDLGHRLGQANALRNLGVVRRLTGDYPAAAQALAEALRLSCDVGHRLAQANVLIELGVVRRLTGDYPAAAHALAEALGLFREFGEPGGEAEALNETGNLDRVRGNINLAEARHRQALDLARGAGFGWDEAYALAGLGRCALAAGRTAQGGARLRQAHEIFRRIGAVEAAGVAAELDALRGPPARRS